MKREDIEKCFSYHAAGAALEYYEQEHSQSSGIESNDVVNAFEVGADWAQKFLIDKACKWLDDNFMNLIWGATRSVYAGGNFATVDEMIANFRKAMEE